MEYENFVVRRQFNQNVRKGFKGEKIESGITAYEELLR